jgi:cystathionine beta-lyase
VDFGGATPAEYIKNVAKVVLVDGAEFSQETSVDTESFVRLNFATSKDTVELILDRIQRSLSG